MPRPRSELPSRACAGCALLALLCLARPIRSQDEEHDSGGGSTPADSIWSDPTFGGRLHTTYRATFTGRIYDFKGYDIPFRASTASAGQADQEQARQLRERHKDTSDQDLDQYVAFRLDQIPVLEESSKALSSVGGDASFRYFKDLDGSPAGEESHGGFDRYDGRQAFQLQTLSARFEALNRHLDLVVGRQYGREAEWLHYDGGTATLRGIQILGRETELTAFAGSRVFFYSRSESPWSGLGPRGGEGIYGGHWKTWVSDSTRLRISDVYYADNSLEAELRQELTTSNWVSVLYRQINEDPCSVSADLAWEWPEPRVSLYFSYLGKLGRNADDFNFDFTQSERRRSHDARDFYFNIGDIEPYDEGTLELRKGLGEHFGVLGGGTIHRLRERDRNDNYNTDWQEAWLGLDSNDAPWKGLSARGTVRYVHTVLPRRRIRLNIEDVVENGVPDLRPEDVRGTGEPSFLGVEALVEQDFFRKVAVGSTAIFRAYDTRSNFAELENLTAASLSGHVRWKVTWWSQLLLSYSYDTDYRFVNPDLDSVHTVRLQCLLRW